MFTYTLHTEKKEKKKRYKAVTGAVPTQKVGFLYFVCIIMYTLYWDTDAYL